MLLCRLVLAVLVVVALAGGAQAKGKADERDWFGVVVLARGTEIVVRTKANEVFAGQIGKVDAAGLTLVIGMTSPVVPTGAAAFSRTIRRDDVQEVRRLKGSRWKGALIGGAIGTGVGVGLGVAADARSENHEFRGLIAGVLGLLGGLAGSAVGWNHPGKGKVIYRAP